MTSKYRSGVQNVDADALSRRPHPGQNLESQWTDISADSIRAICNLSEVTKEYSCPERGSDHLGLPMHAIPKAYCNLSTLNLKGMDILSLAEISTAQQEDPALNEIWKAVKQGEPDHIKSKNSVVLLLLREWERLKLRQDVMYRITVPPGRNRRS